MTKRQSSNRFRKGGLMVAFSQWEVGTRRAECRLGVLLSSAAFWRSGGSCMDSGRGEIRAWQNPELGRWQDAQMRPSILQSRA